MLGNVYYVTMWNECRLSVLALLFITSPRLSFSLLGLIFYNFILVAQILFIFLVFSLFVLWSVFRFQWLFFRHFQSAVMLFLNFSLFVFFNFKVLVTVLSIISICCFFRCHFCAEIPHFHLLRPYFPFILWTYYSESLLNTKFGVCQGWFLLTIGHVTLLLCVSGRFDCKPDIVHEM